MREAKSVSRDETFATDLDDDAALAARLLSLADRASADVRDAGLLARTVTVKLRDADFTTRQASRTLRSAVESDRVVYAVARELLARLRAARRMPARLLGVALSQFVSAGGDGQLSLLESSSPDADAAEKFGVVEIHDLELQGGRRIGSRRGNSGDDGFEERKEILGAVAGSFVRDAFARRFSWTSTSLQAPQPPCSPPPASPTG